MHKTCGGQGETKILDMGFPKLRVSFLGVSVVRTVAFGGLYCGPLFR